MKNLRKQLIVLISLALIFSLSACDQNSQNKESQDKTKLEKKMEDIKSNVEKEQNQIEKELNKTVDEFDERISVYEDDLKKADKKLDAATEEIVMNLKAQRDSIKAEAKMVRNITEDNWEDFKKKVKKESSDFQNDVEEFFTEQENK